jgi:hypothetical protein
MSNPTKEEINRVLAEFEGWQQDANSGLSYYRRTKDGIQEIISLPDYFLLDSLVPIWGKIGKLSHWTNIFTKMMATLTGLDRDKTIQEAAALATYYAVLELRSER